MGFPQYLALIFYVLFRNYFKALKQIHGFRLNRTHVAGSKIAYLPIQCIVDPLQFSLTALQLSLHLAQISENSQPPVLDSVHFNKLITSSSPSHLPESHPLPPAHRSPNQFRRIHRYHSVPQKSTDFSHKLFSCAHAPSQME